MRVKQKAGQSRTILAEQEQEPTPKTKTILVFKIQCVSN